MYGFTVNNHGILSIVHTTRKIFARTIRKNFEQGVCIAVLHFVRYNRVQFFLLFYI